MNKTDDQYQQVVNDLADEFLRHPSQELAGQPDYGSITRQMDGSDVSVAFWHHRMKENVDHIVFIAGRRLLIPFFYRKFISGVVFGPTINPRLMTDEEVGEYD